MRRANRSFLAALTALAVGLAGPSVLSAQEAEPQPEATPQEAQQKPQQEASGNDESQMADDESAANSSSDLVEVARAQGNLNRFLDIVDEAGLTAELSTGGPYTIFAPNDEAFAAVEKGEPGTAAELRRLVRTHVAVGDWTSAELADATEIENLLADELTLEEKAGADETGELHVAGATVVESDIEASNGVIHEIDAVLDVSPTPSTEANAGMMKKGEIDRPASEGTGGEVDSADAAEAGAGD